MNPFQPIEDQEQGLGFIFEGPERSHVSEPEVTKKSMAAGLLLDAQTGEKVKEELLIEGDSPTLNSITESARSERVEGIRADVSAILSDQSMDDQEKRDFILRAKEDIEGMRTPTITELLMEKEVIEAEADTPNAEDIQQMLAEKYDLIVEADHVRRMAPSTINFTNNPIELFFDIAVSFALPNWNVNVREVVNEVFPGAITMTDILPWPLGRQGQAIADVKERIRNLPPKERMDKIRQLAKAIDENKVYWMENSAAKVDLSQTLIDDLNSENWEIYLDNLIGIVDYSGLGIYSGLAKLGAKAGSKLIPKLLSKQVDAAVTAASENFKKNAKEALTKLNTAPTEPVVVTDGVKATVSKEAQVIADTLRRVDELMANPSEKKPGTSLAHKLEQVNPIKAKVVLEGALNDQSGQMAKALGTENTQIAADNVLPTKVGEPTRPIVDLNDIDTTRIDYKVSRGFYTPEEIRAAQNLTEQTLRLLSPSFQPSKMEVVEIPGGYVGKMIIGDSGTHGFSTMKAAEDVAKGFKEYDPATTEILVRDISRDEFVPVKQAANEGWLDQNKGEFLVRVNVVEYLNPSHALKDVEVFHPNSIVGKAAAWLDKSSVFSSWLVRAGNIAADQEALKVRELVSVLKPMTSLREKQQAKVISLLDQGDREQKWYTDVELRDIWGEDPNFEALYAGYKAVVTHQQIVRKLLNDRTRGLLQQEGWRHVVLPRGQFQETADQIGRVFTGAELKVVGEGIDGRPVEARINRIYDSTLNRMVKFNMDDYRKLKDANPEGVQIIEIKDAIKVGKERTKYILHKTGGSLELKELPADVIRDIPGYVARIYDAPYILKVVYSSRINGIPQKSRKAVRMYSTRGEAMRDKARLDELMAKNQDDVYDDLGLPRPDDDEIVLEYKVSEANELRQDSDFANRTSLEYFEHTGQLFTSHRGVEIAGLDGSRRLKSISDSIAAGRAKAARSATLDPLVDKLVSNWEKRYGQKFGVDGKMPFDTKNINRASVKQDATLSREYAEAVALQRHIKLIAGVDDSIFNEAIRSLMISGSDYLSTNFDKVWINELAAGMVRNRHRNPVNLAKGAAFTHLIIFNPIRQLPLQAMQMSVYLGLDHAAKYFLSPRGMQDYLGLMYGTLLRDSEHWGTWGKKTGAQLAKMSEEEYEHFIDVYKQSGLSASVDTHMYAMFSDLERGLGKSNPLVKPWHVFNNVRKVMRRVGFDAGEQLQLGAAYLAVRNKWIKNNPKIAHKWDTPDVQAKIWGEAREVSYNMNKTGAMQFQKGLLGGIFQFMAHATKSSQVLLPQHLRIAGRDIPGVSKAYYNTLGKLSNKAFSDAERMRIAMTQLSLFGTGAFGLPQLWEQAKASLGIEAPEEVDIAVREGLVGSSINIIANAMTPDDQRLADIQYSPNAAPFSGISGQQHIVGMGNPISSMLNSLVLQDKVALELNIPAWTVAKRYGNAVAFTMAALGVTQEMPTEGMPTGSLTVAVLNEWGQLFPIYSNFMRGRVAKVYDQYITTTGNRGVQTVDGEEWALQWMGLAPRAQNWLQDQKITIKGLPGHPQEKGLGDAIDSDAENWYKYLRTTTELIQGQKMDPLEALRIVQTNARVLNEALTDDEQRRFYGRVRKLILNDVTKDGLETQFTKAVIQAYGAFIPDVRDPAFIAEIQAGPDFKGKADLIKWLQELNQWQTIE